MAFTTLQLTKVRHGLGYPQVYQQANPRLESAMLIVGADADASSLVVALLASIDNVRAQIEATALESAGLKSLDKGDVELYQDNQQTRGMRSIGRGYCAELSHLFGVPIANDIFGERGYSGDGWKPENARVSMAGLG